VRRPRFIRRREVWLPTAWGVLVLALIALALFELVRRAIHPFLAPDAPTGQGVLVVEGWISESAFDAAAAAWRGGGYSKLVTAGGPIEAGPFLGHPSTYAELAALSLRRRGVPDEAIEIVPAPASAQDRTFLSAVTVREWIDRTGQQVAALDVFSEGAHARRTWILYRMAFADGLRVGIRAAPPRGYDPDAWWRTTGGAKEVLVEAIGWAYVTCCFHPGARGSLEEKWGPPRGH
jgi:hypothetical protein